MISVVTLFTVILFMVLLLLLVFIGFIVIIVIIVIIQDRSWMEFCNSEAYAMLLKKKEVKYSKYLISRIFVSTCQKRDNIYYKYWLYACQDYVQCQLHQNKQKGRQKERCM